jgi:hypothetical protein
MGSYYLRFILLADVFILLGGTHWCMDVFRRVKSDLDVVQTSDDRAHKGVIIFWWCVTGLLLALMVICANHLVSTVGSFLSGWI